MFELGWVELSLAALLLLALLYRYSTSTFGFWAARGVPFRPPVPLFGNSLDTSLGRVSLPEQQLRNYAFFGSSRFGGVYTFRRPTLFVKDPNLVEQVLIKDFSTFYNRGFKPDIELDPLSAHLVNLEDAKWKNLRNRLTPAFSSGKLRGMQDQLLEVSDILVQQLDTFAKTGQPVEVKKVMSNFAVDLIGSVAFGLSLNSLTDPNSEFKKIGEQIFKPSLKGRLRMALRAQFPRLLRLLNWKSLPKETEDFFIKVVKDTMKYRSENQVQRNDFLQLLMELRKQDIMEPKKDDDLVFDDTLMAANAFVFLLAGYDTTATTISFLLYELAANPDIQEQIYSQIHDKMKKHGGLTYDAVKEMELLDQALSETLRLYPPAGAIVRKARYEYKVPDSDLTLPAGSFVFIPIYSLQRDPKYWDDPERFHPSRFADPDSITKGTYLPFGDGPRICIGLRLAKMEVKVGVVQMLLKYKLTVNEKTQVPFKFNARTLFLTPIGGIWLNIIERL